MPPARSREDVFGRHRSNKGENVQVPVDATLEGDIDQVEQSVANYLRAPTEASRHSLLVVLETLDAQADRGDAYGSSVIGSAALGYSSKGAVIGETGLDSVVDEVPGAELTAQFTLVKAAKDEVRGPTAATFAVLQAALAALAGARNQGSTGS
jgi:hypothetical protein